MQPRRVIAAAVGVVLGCAREEPEREPRAVAREAEAGAPVQPARGLRCEGESCEGSWVADADVAALAEHPNRDALRIHFDDDTSDAGFASIVKLPWARHVSISSLANVTDLSPVAQLAELRTLNASGHGIVDLRPLVGLEHL